MQVALLPRDGDARVAWEALQPVLDIDYLEEGSYALLPLIYTRLQQLGVSHAVLPRLRGIHRKAWVASRVSLSVLTQALRALESAQIKTMIVNDVSMAMRVYPQASVRPLTEIEVVVPTEDSTRAAQALMDAGWYLQTQAAAEIAIASNGGLRLQMPDRSGGVVLRSHPIPGAALAGSAEVVNQHLWESAVRVDVEGITTAAPGATEELLYISANAVHGQSWRTIQWVADATLIIRAGNVDWRKLVSLARQHVLGLPLRDALTYLARLTDPPIPLRWQRELASAPVSRRESIAHYVGTRGGRVLGAFPSQFAHYVRTPAPAGSAHGIRDGLAFFKQAWALDRWSDAPRFFARVLVERIRARRPNTRERQFARPSG